MWKMHMPQFISTSFSLGVCWARVSEFLHSLPRLLRILISPETQYLWLTYSRLFKKPFKEYFTKAVVTGYNG